MKDEKGSIRNRIQGWYIRKKDNEHKKKEQEYGEKYIKKGKKQDKYVQIYTTSDTLKNYLKRIFGMVFAKIENLFSDKKVENENGNIPLQSNLFIQNETKEISSEEHFNEENASQDKEGVSLLAPSLSPLSLEKNLNVEQGLGLESTIQSENINEINKKVDSHTQEIVPLEPIQKPSQVAINSQKEIVEEAKESLRKLIQAAQQFEATNKMYSKKIVEEITEITNDIKKVSFAISNDTSTEHLERKNIIDLKNEVLKIKGRYHELIKKSSLNYIKKIDGIEHIDEYNLRNGEKELNRLIHKCDEKLSFINKKKRVHSILVNENDLKVLKIAIEKNFERQENDINNLKKLFNQAKFTDKRKTFVEGVHNLLAKALSLEFSTTCKNKFIEVLGSTIILNNRIRSIRKVLRKENDSIEYLTYKYISDSLNEQKDYIEKSKNMVDDSIHQLKTFKQEFIMEFYYDMDRYPQTESIMEAIAELEYQVRSKADELDSVIEKHQGKSRRKDKTKDIEFILTE